MTLSSEIAGKEFPLVNWQRLQKSILAQKNALIGVGRHRSGYSSWERKGSLVHAPDFFFILLHSFYR
jgi:hypothetical protein